MYLRLLISFLLLENAAAQLVTLYADTTDLSAGHQPHLTCHHDFYQIVSWWLNGEIALSAKVNGGECMNSPTNPDYLADCTCANTVHTCTLKYLSWSNVGDQWACSIRASDGTVIKSNILTLTLPAAQSVTLYADTTDLSAGHSPHLTCHHDFQPLVSWWHYGETALSANVKGGKCMNRPTNPDYLADCTCATTVHTCSLHDLSRSNVGDQWACSIRAWNGTVIKSNILTLTLPARGKRANIAVIAGSVGGAVGGLIIIVLIFILWKRRKPGYSSVGPTNSQPDSYSYSTGSDSLNA